MSTTKNPFHFASACRTAAALCVAAASFVTVHAAPIDLADQPLFSTSGAPGNLLLAVSAEWPTVSTPAYLSTTAYSAATAYVGYFDAAKCYRYVDYTVPANGYFTPHGMATDHACTSTAAVSLWSGNYLNWASTQTMDAFRWALTGGDRVVDTATSTIIEKTRHSGQGSRSSIYPDKSLSSGISGATPFSWTNVVSRVHGLGTALYFSAAQELSCAFATNNNRRTTFTCDASSVGGGTAAPQTGNNLPGTGGSTTVTAALTGSAGTLSCTVTRSAAGVNGGNDYTYSCTTSLSGSTACAAAATYASSAAAGTCNTASTVTDYAGQSSAASTASATANYKVNARVKVCDSTVGLESNCKQYGSNHKPEGLIQQYAQKLRFSTFSYLNDSGTTPFRRDGGVMRARMKYVGPTTPAPGSPSVTNTKTEWDAATGVMVQNPDASDATATTDDSTTAGYTVTITNSGVMNYLNRFGKVETGNYKGYDPVGEMYYAGQRYFRNLGNVSEYSSLADAGSLATMKTWLDGFPVIKTWDDPILYSCQKNFILGIGDVYTHRDKNLRGSTIRGTDEPAIPAAVDSDTTVDVTTATDMVGQLEGLTSLGSTLGGSGSTGSYFIAGLAYDAHTKDIRADLAGSQNISTYWLDVMEGQTYRSKNQYWLAAKYGGFTVPAGFNPYAPGNGTSTLTDDSWWNSGEMTPDGADKRPDNYFLANQADKMVEGLTKAFAKIVSENDSSTTTAFATPTAKVSNTDGASYAAYYEPKTWSGVVIGSKLSFDTDGTPTVTKKWDARALLDTTAHGSRKIVTCCDSAGASLPFRAAGLAAATLSARTDYASFASVPGVAAASQSAANYVDYLRGDRTKEVGGGGVYRKRSYLLGDVSGSKTNPVGPPSAPYFDLTNPGYSTFKRNKFTRKTVVYVGANDGMMHAFDGTLPGATACTSCGTELFAYVPSFTYRGSDNSASTTGLASLGNSSFLHHFFVDATPQNFDIDFKNTVGSTATANDWRTVLIGGLGKGGKGYYAIDVTDPTSWTDEAAVAGKVLWEFTDPDMGYSYGDASVVKTTKYGWVVIFTSGYNNSDGKGYFFIVNPRTGALLQKIATPDGSAAEPLNMAHHTAYVPDYTNFTSDSVYAGDLRGNVWRLDLTGTPASYPAPIKFATLADSGGTAQPVTTRPLIEVDPGSKKRYVLVGTGRLLADSDTGSTQRQALYAIIDGTASAGTFYTSATLPGSATFPVDRGDLNANTDLLAGIGSSPANPMGWYLDLGPTDGSVAERININAVSNVGVIGLGVNKPGGSACAPGGSSRVLAMTFGNGKSVLVNSSNVLIAESTVSSGMVTDIGILNAGGKIRLVAGDTSGGVQSPKLGESAALSLKRLNWREVPTVD